MDGALAYRGVQNKHRRRRPKRQNKQEADGACGPLGPMSQPIARRGRRNIGSYAGSSTSQLPSTRKVTGLRPQLKHVPKAILL